jgi:N-acetylmuramoyl-L-alanine amidase
MMDNLPSVTWFQQQLAQLGYETPQTGELDVATRHVLAAFQMHYRPERFDGQPDVQSAAILQVLNHQR